MTAANTAGAATTHPDKTRDVDLYDPDQYVLGVPHDKFTWLRAHDPVHWNDEPGDGRGYWAVMKHADITHIGKNPDLFSSALGATNIEDFPASDLSLMRLMMLNMDPPQHNKFRRLVQRGFTPRMVKHLEAAIQANATSLVDAIVDKGRCELVRDVSAPLPLWVIADLIGIPEEGRLQVFHWSNRLIGMQDPEYQLSAEDQRGAAAELWAYANGLVEERKKNPRERSDLLHVLLHGEVDGDNLTVMEFDLFVLLLSVAGNETTRNLISGAMAALLAHPEQLEKLENNLDEHLETAVEEFLRWVTPVMYFRRTATQDTTLGDKHISKGDKVVMYYGSANRDEDVFEDAHKFDIAREHNPHLTFGVGQHFCLGASLARLEIRIIFRELLSRITNIRLAGETRRLRSNFINGIKEMPLEFDKR